MGQNLKRVVTGMVVGLFVLTLAQSAWAEPLKIDSAHSFVMFKVKHFDAGYTWGRFNNPTGTVNIDSADPGKSSIEINLKAESVDTGNEQRDAHLKRPDFFDARQYPDITFKSTSVKKTGDKTYEVTGDLNLHGQTKPLTVTLTQVGQSERQGYREGYESSFTIKRSDWGMTGMVGPVGDEVTLYVALEATR